MTKPIVLLIHGMGTHSKDATKDAFIKGLAEASKNLGLEDVEEKLDIYEFNYSEELDAVREEIKVHADKHDEVLDILKAVGGPTAVAASLIEWQQKFSDDTFIYTHLMDVALYAMTYHGVEISTKLAGRIHELMVEAKREGKGFHVVPHSLGTKVAYDALLRLFGNNISLRNGNKINPKLINLDSLWMTANVSRLVGILDDMPEPFETIVNDGEGGVASLFYNLRNKYDPFTWLKTYDKPPYRGQNIEFDDLRKIEDEKLFLNPHALEEYFAYPPIADAFLRVILNHKASPPVFKQAMDSYEASTIAGQLKVTVEKVEEVFDIKLSEQDSLEDRFEAIKSLVQSLEKIKKDTKAYISNGGE